MVERFNELFTLHKDDYNLRCVVSMVSHRKTSLEVYKLGYDMPFIDLKHDNIYALYLQAYRELEKYINNTTLS